MITPGILTPCGGTWNATLVRSSPRATAVDLTSAPEPWGAPKAARLPRHAAPPATVDAAARWPGARYPPSAGAVRQPRGMVLLHTGCVLDVVGGHNVAHHGCLARMDDDRTCLS